MRGRTDRRESFERQFLDAIESLARAEETSVWTAYRDLRTLESFLESVIDAEPAEAEFHSKQVRWIGEWVADVKTGRSSDDDHSPLTLDPSERDEICERVLETVRKEALLLEWEMPTRVREELRSTLQSLRDQQVSTAVMALRTISGVLDGAELDDPDDHPISVGRIVTRLADLRASNALSDEQKHGIEADLNYWVADGLSELRQQLKEKYSDRFDE